MEQPRSGIYHPRSTGEFQAWFRTDAAAAWFCRVLELAAGHDPVRFQHLLAAETAPGTGRAGLGSPAKPRPSSGQLAMENRRAPAAATNPAPVK